MSAHSYPGATPDQGDTQIDLMSIYRILFRGRWLILASLVIAVAVSLFWTSRMPRIYRATATAMVVTNNPWESGLLVDGSGSAPAFSIADQLQILESRKLATQVIHSLLDGAYVDRLAVLHDEDGNKLIAPEQAARHMLLDLAVRQQKNSNVLAISYMAPTGFEAALVANTVAEIFYQQNQEFSRAEYTELTVFLKEQLDLVAVRLQHAETQLAGFKESRRLSALDIETATIVEQSAAAQAELNAIALNLRTNETALNNLQRQYSQGQSTLVDDLDNLSTATIEQLSQDIAEKQAQIANVRARAETGWEQYVVQLESELRRVKEALKEETRKISSTEMKSVDPLGTMQQIFDRIIELDVENRSLRAAYDAQSEIVAQFEERLQQLPEASLEYVRYTRDVEINERLYRLLTEKYEENKAVAAGMIGNVRLLDEAEVPEYPVSPNKNRNLILAIVSGLLLGAAASFLQKMLDASIVTPDELRSFHLNLLGSVPTINVRKLDRALRQSKRDELSEEEKVKVRRKLITHFSPKSPISEGYRSLRTNLLMKLEQNGVSERTPVVMITSGTTQEGKSLTSANLSVTLAQADKRVLVIDADMRRPTTHKNFALDRSIGLSGVLAGSQDRSTAVQATDIPNLYVLPAGPIPSNPAELLGKQSLVDLLDWARKEYDFVIVDSPPVVPVTDPAVLSRVVDGVILVIRSAKSHRRELSEALSRLKHADAQLLGVVLNDYDLKRVYGSYYYYYHYYDRYYYYGDRKRKRSRNPERRTRRRASA